LKDEEMDPKGHMKESKRYVPQMPKHIQNQKLQNRRFRNVLAWRRAQEAKII
jgi:hypothetical protein